METIMKSRLLAASVLALLVGLTGAATPGLSADTAPLTVAAAEATAPNFVGLSNWFNSAPLNISDLHG
jgi:hypothetical protein